MPILKLSFRAWRKSPLSQLGATLISASLLLCVALLFCVELSIVETRSHLEKENRITVFLAPSVDNEDKNQVIDRLSLSIGAHAESDVQAQYVSPSEALDVLKGKYPELYQEIQGIGREGESLVPRSVHLTANFRSGEVGEAVAKLRNISGVESVESTESRNAFVLPAILGFQWLIRLLFLGVAAAWVLGWLSLARAHSAGLVGVKEPLRLWGASSWVSRGPGILSGLWVGFPAGIIAAIAYLGFARPVIQRVALSSQIFQGFEIPGVAVALVLLCISSIAGLASGTLSGSSES